MQTPTGSTSAGEVESLSGTADTQQHRCLLRLTVTRGCWGGIRLLVSARSTEPSTDPTEPQAALARATLVATLASMRLCAALLRR